MPKSKSLQWEDFVGAALGMWLFGSPLTLGYAGDAVAATNAMLMGAVLVCGDLADLGPRQRVQEWIAFAVGVWLCISPYALGFASDTAAANNAIAVGLLSLFFTLFEFSSLDEKVAHWWHEHGVKL